MRLTSSRPALVGRHCSQCGRGEQSWRRLLSFQQMRRALQLPQLGSLLGLLGGEMYSSSHSNKCAWCPCRPNDAAQLAGASVYDIAVRLRAVRFTQLRARARCRWCRDHPMLTLRSVHRRSHPGYSCTSTHLNYYRRKQFLGGPKSALRSTCENLFGRCAPIKVHLKTLKPSYSCSSFGRAARAVNCYR